MSTTGYCKVCQSPLVKEINKRLERGESAPSVVEWAAMKGFSINRKTVLSHKRHITDPRQTFVEQARRDPAIRNVTTDQVIQGVKNAGFANLMRNPQSVTNNQMLSAVKIEEGRREKQVNMLVLAQIFTKKLPPPEEPKLLEGEWHEADAQEESE